MKWRISAVDEESLQIEVSWKGETEAIDLSSLEVWYIYKRQVQACMV